MMHCLFHFQAGREENFEVDEDKAKKDAAQLYNVCVGCIIFDDLIRKMYTFQI